MVALPNPPSNLDQSFARMYLFLKSSDSSKTKSIHGRLNLRLTGFSEQSVVPLDDIVRSIDLLPAFHLEGLREIVYAPDWTPTETGDLYFGLPRPKPKAEFIQRQRKIVIYDFHNSALFFQILFHEIGHFVFFLIISSVVKKRWVTEIYPGSECATKYGTSSAAEDFAETYAYYMRDSDFLMEKLPQKYFFMRDDIFSGRTETLKEVIDP